MAHNEQVFTPKYIVENILDKIGYIANFDGKESNIRKKHIIDNSCGNGAFLCEVVSRYIDACINDDLSEEEIINELETYIHGIEIDGNLCTETQNNLMDVCKMKGFDSSHIISFDIHWKNSLDCKEFDKKMDFVVGNPPYCKVHDLKEKYEKVKEYKFAQGGMTDLYLVFFEIGINMLNDNGKLGYITPNSWMTSKAGFNFRQWIKNTCKLSEIVQFGGERIFNTVTTFTNITIIDNSKTDNSFLYSFGVDDTVNKGEMSLSFINDNFYLGDKNTLRMLNDIILSPTYHKIKIKNGFATLNDKLFIMTTDWKEMVRFEHNMILMWKASKDKTVTAVYPYDREGKPIKYEDLYSGTRQIMNTQAYLFDVDTTSKDWYLYGRYQGIKDISEYRIGINNIIKDINSINIKLLRPYEGIYSGLYFVCEDDDFIIKNFNEIVEKIKNEDFIKYVKSLGKYKNGDYYTFSSKDLENYINFKFFN